jgi:nucleotide sugar dehydrogenase
MLDAVLEINEAQPLRMISLLEKEMNISGKRVAVLGLAFKPGTDDLRESPALPLIAALLQKGAAVVAHDPVAMPLAMKRQDFSHVSPVDSWREALQDSDACCLVTAWPEYRSIHPAEFAKRMRRPLLIDGRGIFDPAAMAASGVTWRGVGYTPVFLNGHSIQGRS